MAVNFGNAIPTAGKFGNTAIAEIKFEDRIFKFIDTMSGTQAITLPTNGYIASGHTNDDDDDTCTVDINSVIGIINSKAPARVRGNIIIKSYTAESSYIGCEGEIIVGGVSTGRRSFYDPNGDRVPTIHTVPVDCTLLNRSIAFKGAYTSSYASNYVFADFSGLIFY